MTRPIRRKILGLLFIATKERLAVRTILFVIRILVWKITLPPPFRTRRTVLVIIIIVDWQLGATTKKKDNPPPPQDCWTIPMTTSNDDQQVLMLLDLDNSNSDCKNDSRLTTQTSRNSMEWWKTDGERHEIGLQDLANHCQLILFHLRERRRDESMELYLTIHTSMLN